MSQATLKRFSSTDRDISPPPPKRKVTSTTSSATVSNFFKPASQKAPDKVSFSTVQNSLLIARHQAAATTSRPRPWKVAAFDLDDTLITTKSGNRFSRGRDDWRWWNAVVPGRLKELHAQGYAIVVISNQAAVALRSDPKAAKGSMKSVMNFKEKVTSVLNALELPITVYAATEHDLFRKPRTGMWEQMLQDCSLTEHGDIDREACVFVGDAAGREADKNSGVRKDHSCSDRDFAANVGIPFHTPEEYFLGEAVKPFIRTFNPADHLTPMPPSSTDVSPVIFTKKHDRDIVVFCGSPGAGKSTFYWRHLQPLGYERVNQDTLKTRDKCLKVAEQHLEDGKPVAVDNTNADIETRAVWISLAWKMKVPIRLVHFTASTKLCEHNDTVRALGFGDGSMNPEARTLLPKSAFAGYQARYREPKVAEGFEDITKVDFVFEGTESQKAMWSRFWIS